MANNLEKLSDEDLINNAKSNNGISVNSVSELFNRYKWIVHIISNNILKKREDVEDNIHDVFLIFYSNINKFENKHKNSFHGWISKISYNTAISKYRKKVYRNTNNFSEIVFNSDSFFDQSSLYWLLDESDSPEQIKIRKDRQEKVFFELNKLDKEKKGKIGSMLYKYYFLDKSYKEISDSLGIPMGTVKSKIHFAKKTLKDSLKEYRFLD